MAGDQGAVNPGPGRRRFTRPTNACSEKVENLRAAVALHVAHYNFVRVHGKPRVTPAMAAGVTDRLWSLEELVAQTGLHPWEWRVR
jgi:hypothetical protein